MKAAIHQLHYFPWTGYLNKMASSDVFILLDTVQITYNSYMSRHKLLATNGQPKYITVPYPKKHYRDRPYNDLEVNNDVPWQQEQKNFIWGSYRHTPYFQEIWKHIEPVFEKEYEKLWEVTFDSLLAEREMFGITTPLVLQSTLEDRQVHKTELMLDLCRQVGADTYLCGNGARKYMDEQIFHDAGVGLEYQQFTQPQYSQTHAAQFVPGISALDMLFACGIQQSRTLFWQTVKKDAD